jgi:hypothetical protein
MIILEEELNRKQLQYRIKEIYKNHPSIFTLSISNIDEILNKNTIGLRLVFDEMIKEVLLTLNDDNY